MIDLGRLRRSRLATLAAFLAWGVALPVGAQTGHEHHRPPAPVDSEALGSMSIPDPVLLDQDGREVRFYTDLVKDRVVAMNFIFTTCTTVCPPMGANFSRLQKLMGERVGRDFEMISVSVDPAVDTPARLKDWARKFGRRDGWTLLTGSKPDVDRLLKALKVFTADKNDHSPTVLVGDDARGEWTRAYGLAPPARLAEMIGELATSARTGTGETRGGEPDAARAYFTDVELIDQEGEKLRLYSDLMRGKVVVISAIFTTCEGVCPVTMGNLVKIQSWLGPRLGKDVNILSLTVDRETDTPARLREYAREYETGPGWYFLTGSPENLDSALRKLGLWVEDKEAHSTTFLIGNVATGLWKKAFGMAPAKDLIEILDSVLDDRLETAGGAVGRR